MPWLLLGLVLLPLRARNTQQDMPLQSLLLVGGCTVWHQALQPLPSSTEKPAAAAAAAAALKCC
jgi:hypothetical protein